jgi:hypothetical protein
LVSSESSRIAWSEGVDDATCRTEEVMAMIVAAKLLNPFMKAWYWYVSRADKAAQATFLNYGYVDDAKDLDLEKTDEANRYPIQLYHHIAHKIDLGGKDALEVGSGRGGRRGFLYRQVLETRVRDRHRHLRKSRQVLQAVLHARRFVFLSWRRTEPTV